jgi:hypothetical protein
MKPTRVQIRGLSMTFGALLFALVSIVVIPMLEEKGVVAQIAAAVVAALSIERSMAFTENALLKWWAKDILGEWFYFSEYSAASHFAHAEVYVRAADLHYRVNLYHLPQITAIAQGNSIQQANSHGTAKDLAFFYDGAVEVEILYAVDRPDDSSGKGILTVVLNQNKKTMTGNWVTARDDEGPRSGNMRWYRRAEFLEFLQSQQSGSGQHHGN